MPTQAHKALNRAARKAGFTKGSERYRRYVYGTLTKIEQKTKKKSKAGKTKTKKKS